jgi:iron complex outermembrane recepter protein
MHSHFLKPTLAVAPLVAAVSAALFASSAHAQSPAPATPAPQKIEKIEITGSNIKRADAETSSSIQVITKDEIQKSGVETVAELLRAVPAIAGGALQDYDGGSGFSRATQSASLRGLGSIGTLILLNGRRVSPAPNADPNTGQGQSYNLNTIPLSAIERIEILKDGASAIYGSDAIAGVINFILKKDYSGGEIRASGRSSLDNTFREYSANGIVGFGDLAKDRYNVLVGLDFFKRDPVGYNEPNAIYNDDYRRLANRNALTSTFTGIPNYYRERTLGNGVFNVALATDPRCPAAVTVATTAGCRANAFDYLQITSKSERAGFIAKATRDFSATLQGTAELSFTRVISSFTDPPATLDGTGNGSIWFNAAGQRFRYLLTLPVGHPDNPYTFPVGLRYRFVDLGTTQTETTNDQYRALVSFSGTIANWDWESGLLYSKTERKETANGRLYLPALLDAVNNRTYRFGGTNSASVLAALNPYRTSSGATDITSFDLKGSRELANLSGGPLVIAAGIEARRESFDITSDPRQVAGEFVGIASTTVGNSRRVQSAFSELSIPFVKNVETQLAVRFDHYSDYGNSTTPKVGFKWKALGPLAVRATYGEAFRAPSLTQSSTSRVQSFSTITDPVRCPNGSTPLPGGDTQDCTGRTVASIFLPAAGLEPERSKNFSYGFIYSPMNNLSVQTDAWEIRRRNQIDRFSAQQVINNEFTPGYTGGSVVRNTNPASFLTDAQGRPIPGTGPLESTTRRFLNLGETRVKGVDLEVNGSIPFAGGKLSLASISTWTIRYDYQLNKGGPFVNGAGNFYLFETPRLRSTNTVTYTSGGIWSAFARYNYVGGWDYGDPTVANGCYLTPTSATLAFLGQCKVQPWKTVDIGGSISPVKQLTVSLVVRNVENKRAPYDPNQTTLGFNPTYHNPQGANATLSATYRF